MTALIPTSSQANGVETYEDMFKEITRKLYGEETSHGLHTLGTPVAHIASGTNTNIPDGERSFTTLVSSMASIFFFFFWKEKRKIASFGHGWSNLALNLGFFACLFSSPNAMQIQLIMNKVLAMMAIIY